MVPGLVKAGLGFLVFNKAKLLISCIVLAMYNLNQGQPRLPSSHAGASFRDHAVALAVRNVTMTLLQQQEVGDHSRVERMKRNGRAAAGLLFPPPLPPSRDRSTGVCAVCRPVQK